MGAAVQAPWKQIQIRRGTGAENKLGLFGGYEPASLGQVGNSREKSWSGLFWDWCCAQACWTSRFIPGWSPGQLGSRDGKGQPGNWQYIHGNVGLGWGHWSCICCFIFCSISCMRLSSSSFILMSFSVSASGVGSGRMGMGLSMRLSWVSLLVICWMQCAR